MLTTNQLTTNKPFPVLPRGRLVVIGNDTGGYSRGCADGGVPVKYSHNNKGEKANTEKG
jgi:hypothetical protein